MLFYMLDKALKTNIFNKTSYN